MSRIIKAANAANPNELILTQSGAVRITEDMIGVHPNMKRQTLYSEIQTSPDQALLYSTFFHTVRSHDSNLGWVHMEPEPGVFVWDRMHQLLDPLIAAGKKIIYVLTDTPYHAVCGNISQRWVPNKSEVTGTTLSDMVFPTVANRNKFMYEVTTAGTSGTSEPTWPTNPGDTVSATGGTAVYTCRYIPSGATYLAHNTNPAGINETTKAGDVVYKVAGTTMPSERSLVQAFITELCTECNGAIHTIEVGNETTFVMEDNNGAINTTWPAFNMSDAETFVSIAHAVKDAIEALPSNIAKPQIAGSGWVNNPSATDNLKQFLEAKDPITGKYGYEMDYDWHSFHIYGSLDIGKVGGVGWGQYTNIKTQLEKLRATLIDYGVIAPKFRITEYGVNANSSGNTDFDALSAADKLTVIKMRMIHALCMPDVIGLDFYSWGAAYNTDFKVSGSPIQQAMSWISGIYIINWAKVDTTTGALTFNYTGNGMAGSSATQTLNYPSGWPESRW